MAEKIIKITTGHNLETYIKKYGYLFSKNKLKYYESKEALNDHKEYWLIDNKYYETSKLTHKGLISIIIASIAVALALSITIPILAINANKKISHFEPLGDEVIHKHVQKNERIGNYTLTLKDYLYGDETIHGKLKESFCSDDRYYLEMQDFNYNYENKSVDFTINLFNKNEIKLPQTIIVGNFTIELFCLKGSQTIWTETLSDLDITFTLDSETTYNIQSYIDNGDLIGQSVITTGSTLNLKISPEYGYGFPETINVIGAVNTYYSETGEILLSNPTSDVTINATCDEIFYDVIVEVTNGTSDITEEKTISKKGTLEFKITPYDNFNLPSYIEVTGAQFTYNKTDGKIKLFNATENVKVIATCIGIPYNITSEITNGKYEGDVIIHGGATAKGKIVPDVGFTYPDEKYITVENATIENYNPETGELTLSNPTKNVKIITTCPKEG